jgi:hypothetical protein
VRTRYARGFPKTICHLSSVIGIIKKKRKEENKKEEMKKEMKKEKPLHSIPLKPPNETFEASKRVV